MKPISIHVIFLKHGLGNTGKRLHFSLFLIYPSSIMLFVLFLNIGLILYFTYIIVGPNLLSRLMRKIKCDTSCDS